MLYVTSYAFQQIYFGIAFLSLGMFMYIVKKSKKEQSIIANIFCFFLWPVIIIPLTITFLRVSKNDDKNFW